MPKKHIQVNVFWFRRDLRFHDNHGLYLALSGILPVLPVFIFDKEILRNLPPDDVRITALYNETERLHSELINYGSSLKSMHGEVQKCFHDLAEEFNIRTVYTNNDYEPYSIQRDNKIKKSLEQKGISFLSVKDHVVFERDEVTKSDGKPYLVYTPYMKKWKEKRSSLTKIIHYPSEEKLNNLLKISPFTRISLKDMRFKTMNVRISDRLINTEIIRNYHKTRDFPALNGTSRLGFHLRLGTISIRELIRVAEQYNDKFLDELIWREFYMMLLWHFPYVATQAFKKEYSFIPWINNEKDFKRWKNGETGIPIVDAGIREMNSSGYMHNRVRMITASFLVKNLLIDWQWGEAYFASKLLDYELASNNGGWQWVAGTGVDAAPYFRVFNPLIQTRKYDPDNLYIKKWITEINTKKYPDPMTDIRKTALRAVDYYQKTISGIKI